MRTHPLPRTVFITGASRGIGAAIATEIQARGYHVIAPTRAQLDLSAPDSVDAYLKANSDMRIDILINNAGINMLNPLLKLSPIDWQLMLQTNLNSVISLIQAFAPNMIAQCWGRILNISTIFSLVTKTNRGAYSMTKAALNALTRSAAVELGLHNILVNSIAPGYIDTDLTRQNNPPEIINAIVETIPLRRMAMPLELAKTVAFLVSNDNTYITGQTIAIDGGFICQ
jgi:3-oxoacyl-[acyl-carrier protein] reductase